MFLRKSGKYTIRGLSITPVWTSIVSPRGCVKDDGTSRTLILLALLFFFSSGYGFVDFESGTCADAAVKGLQAKGVQAQMAKVGIPVQRRAATVRLSHENNIILLYWTYSVKQYSAPDWCLIFLILVYHL